MLDYRIFTVNNDLTGSSRALRVAIISLINSGGSVTLYNSSDVEGHLSDIPGVKYCFGINVYNSNKFFTFFRFLFLQIASFLCVLLFVPRSSVVICNTSLCIAPLLAAWMRGVRSISYIHEAASNPYWITKLHIFLVRKLEVRAILVSEYLRKIFNLENQLSRVVHNCSVFPCRGRAVSTKFTVLMACSPRDYKGVKEFIAVAALSPLINFDLVLSCDELVGVEYLSKFDLPQNISIFYSPTSMEFHYLKSSVVLNLTRTAECIESFGLTIVEAFSFGLPVIVPPIGGPAEIVMHGVNGFLIDSRNVVEISQTLSLLSLDRDLYLELSTNASEQCCRFQNSNFAICVNELVNKY